MFLFPDFVLHLRITPKAALRGARLEEHLLNICSCRDGHQLPPLIYQMISASALLLTQQLFPL